MSLIDDLTDIAFLASSLVFLRAFFASAIVSSYELTLEMAASALVCSILVLVKQRREKKQGDDEER
jgi:hypothetical protein